MAAHGQIGGVVGTWDVSLAAFAWLLTLVPTEAAGRAYAAYGGLYIVASLLCFGSWNVMRRIVGTGARGLPAAPRSFCLRREEAYVRSLRFEATPEEIADHLDLIGLEDFPPRFNIAPTQPILIIVEGERQELGSNLPNRQAMLVRWGFMPGWVKDPKTFPLLINARSETAIGKASFRAAMRHRRILIPASGFYEWKRPAKEDGGKPQAYYIRPKRGGIVAFAGLMEHGPLPMDRKSIQARSSPPPPTPRCRASMTGCRW